MGELPLWPPFVALAFAAIGYLTLWAYNRHLDRIEREEKQAKPGE
ncbi:MAG TPA: hypothetical protein VHG92_04795 [Afifellaceae bacterium]|nr:hypothetical protein [Afifellaceae bacterium]